MQSKRVGWLVFAILVVVPVSIMASVPVTLVSQFTFPDSVVPSGKIEFLDLNHDGYNEIRATSATQVATYSLRDQKLLDRFFLKSDAVARSYASGTFDGDDHLDLVEIFMDQSSSPMRVMAAKWLSGDGYSGKDTIFLDTIVAGSSPVLTPAVVWRSDPSQNAEVYGSTFNMSIICYLPRDCDTTWSTRLFAFDPITNAVRRPSRLPSSSTESFVLPGGGKRVSVEFPRQSTRAIMSGGAIWNDSWFSLVEYVEDSVALNRGFGTSFCFSTSPGEWDRNSWLNAHWLGDVVADVPGSELLLAYGTSESSYSVVGPFTCSHSTLQLACYNLSPVGALNLLWLNSNPPIDKATALFSDPDDPAHFYAYAQSGTNSQSRFYRCDSHTGLPVDSSDMAVALGSWVNYVSIELGGPRYAVFQDHQSFNFYSLDMTTDVHDNPPTALPSSFSLGKPYPNPFNATVTVPITVGRSGKIAVDILNVTGQTVTRLYDGIPARGELRLSWQASKNASGVYLVRLSGADRTETAKVILLK